MKIFRNSPPFKFANCTNFYLLCWFIGKSTLPLIKVMNSCVKNDMDLKNYFSKLVGTRCFFLSKYINKYWRSIVLKGKIMKPPKYIKYVLVECNYLIKLPRHVKVCLVIILNQVISSYSE